MGLVCQYKCADIVFDVYDVDRICTSNTNNLFYMTPSRLVKVQKFLIEKDIPFIDTIEQMNTLIDNDLIGIY